MKCLEKEMIFKLKHTQIASANFERENLPHLARIVKIMKTFKFCINKVSKVL